MTIDEGKDCVAECKLDHNSSFPAPADHVFHDVVLLHVSHEQLVTLFDINDHEDLSFAHEFNPFKICLEVVANKVDLFIFLTSALLTTKGDNVVISMVWEHLLEVQTLGLSCMVPRDSQNVELNFTED